MYKTKQFHKHGDFLSVSKLYFFKSSNPAPTPEKMVAHLQNRRFAEWVQKLDGHNPFFSGHDNTVWFRMARTKMVWCDASKVEPWKLKEVPTVRSSWRLHCWLYGDDKKFMRGSVCDAKLLFGWLNVRLFSNDHYTTRTVGIVWVLIFW